MDPQSARKVTKQPPRLSNSQNSDSRKYTAIKKCTHSLTHRSNQHLTRAVDEFTVGAETKKNDENAYTNYTRDVPDGMVHRKPDPFENGSLVTTFTLLKRLEEPISTRITPDPP